MSILSEVPQAADDARRLARRLADHVRANPSDVEQVDEFERAALLRFGHAGVIVTAERSVAIKRREAREAERARRVANAAGPLVVTRFGSQLTTEHGGVR